MNVLTHGWLRYLLLFERDLAARPAGEAGRFPAEWPTLPEESHDAAEVARRLVDGAATDDVILTNGLSPVAMHVARLLSKRSAAWRPHHVVRELIIPSPTSLAWRLRVALVVRRWRRAVTGVDRILVSTTAEVEAYGPLLGVPGERFGFLPYYSAVQPRGVLSPRPVLVTFKGQPFGSENSIAELPGSEIGQDEDIVLSAGFSFRDHGTFVRAWELAHREVPDTVRALVIAGKSNPVPRSRAPRLTVLRAVSRSAYYEWLRRAAAVVVSLVPCRHSGGQIVALEGMSLGKPIIATRSEALSDYLTPDSGAALFRVGDATALAEKIVELCSDSGRRREAGERGERLVVERFSILKHLERQRAVLEALAGAAARG